MQWQRHLAQAPDSEHGSPARLEASPLSAECGDFIQRHQRDILNYLWRMTGDEQTAYDLTQEVFLRAWQHFDTLRTYEQPRSWLFRVATNLALTHLRRRAPLTSTLDALDIQRHPAMSDPAWRLAERDQVHQALLQLAPQRRAALVLREVYGLSAAEVGQLLDMSETAVRMTLHRARKQFRAIYTREGGASDGE
jgi:RNA polymerase sigma-70 factor (ECF subfamily)